MAGFIAIGDNAPHYKMAPDRYKSFQIVSPKSTHFRPATCHEVDCVSFQRGWRQIIDIKTIDGQKTAYWIRMHSQRHFTVERTQTEGVLAFVFPPGQRCFVQHEVRLERPEVFLTRHGNPLMPIHRTEPQQYRPDQWVDQFASLTDKIQTERNKG